MENDKTEVASWCNEGRVLQCLVFHTDAAGLTAYPQLICCLLYGSHPFSPARNAAVVDRLRQGQVNTQVGNSDL